MEDNSMDYISFLRLLDINNVGYRTQVAYDEEGIGYPCIWLDRGGHIEFDLDENFVKIVDY